jgi:hypothetical protein
MIRVMQHFVFWLALAALVLVVFTALPNQATPPTSLAQEARSEGALDIPAAGQVQIDLDGSCDEYASAAVQTFSDAGGQGRVYLQHDFTNLYICIEAQPGTFNERFASVYLDPQGDGTSYDFAQEDDYSLRVNIPNSTESSLKGTGVANGYTAASEVDAFWQGAASASQTGESIEYSISAGRFFIDDCQIFGLATYHHWVSAVGDDYGWPSNEFFDQPRTWQPARLFSGICTDPVAGRVAYVFRGDTAAAISFHNLLWANGYLTDLIPLSSVVTTDFSIYDLIIIADDTGYLSQWGLAGQTAQQIGQITAPDNPIIGLGEGGYAFFGRLSLFIGWPNGWHGPEDEVLRPSAPLPPPPTAYYDGIAADPVPVYTETVNEVGIYLDDVNTLPPGVNVIGLEPPTPDHASLISQDCRHLWGFSGNAREMTGNGRDLFINAVDYYAAFQCTPPQTPPEACVDVEKTADPPAGTPVQPGDTIAYTLTYVLSDSPDCNNPENARLIDFIPPDTIYVPGSASDGITPTADGGLVWSVTQAAGPQTETFRVRVSDTQCVNQERVNNQARLVAGGSTIAASGLITHPVDCPDIRFPNESPPYSQDEIQITPYPLVSGQPSQITVKVSNASAAPQTVTVSIQTSPDRFGIGLNFNTISSQVVTIPGNGNVIVATTYVPVVPGHYCIQIVVEDASGQRVTTQRNLDVTEDLRPGVPDDLDFKVGNPTASTADVLLTVDNTCPGWTANVSPTLLTNMAPGEVRDATLTVTPPDPVTLGTTCHIDVQGWIDGELIGGIRKLDVPPVQLPPDVDPPWMEPEISVIPDPPEVGQPGQICVELQNPLNVSRNVSVEFAVADFGAGIYFTPVATENFTLPPNSIDDYCTTWTPAPGGTLHRCVLATLSQANYEDQTSQRNVNLVEPDTFDLSQLDLPVLVRNPDFITHDLEVVPTIYGIDPFWNVVIEDMDGNPPPGTLGPNEQVNLRVRFEPNMLLRQDQTMPETFRYGDISRVEIAVLLDGEEIGGFTIDFGEEQSMVNLPVIIR